MVTVSGIIRTIKSTHNFWDAILLRKTTKKKLIKFKNGVAVEIDRTQYNLLRDWFEDLTKQSFTIYKQDNNYIIKNTKGQPDFDFITQAETIHTAKPLFDSLMELNSKGWTIKRDGGQYLIKKGGSISSVEQLSEDTYRLKSDTLELLGPREVLFVQLCECDEGLYDYDFSGKTVLDIGGFCGETAAYFSSRKAKKVIVYEPVKEHHQCIRTNAKLNNVNIEVHEVGIGSVDGTVVVKCGDHAGLGFGLDVVGQKTTTIEIRNVTDVLLQSKADVAKIDCEGAEISLTQVAPEVLGLIPYYFIETHSEELEKAVTAKFLSSGFKEAREPVFLSKGISMLYFEKTKGSN